MGWGIMATVTITIKTDNAAFDNDGEFGGPGVELANILNDFANHVAPYSPIWSFDGMSLMDSNGNKVGTVTVK